MANRLHAILSDKAAMGMGYRMKNRVGYGDGELEDIMQLHGRGVMAGRYRAGFGTPYGARSNPWIDFVRFYAEESGQSYADALQDPDTSSSYKEYKKGLDYRQGLPPRKPRLMNRTSCPKGKFLKPVKGYTRKKNNKQVKPYNKCIYPRKRKSTTRKKRGGVYDQQYTY
jgi:hypothetical protein